MKRRLPTSLEGWAVLAIWVVIGFTLVLAASAAYIDRPADLQDGYVALLGTGFTSAVGAAVALGTGQKETIRAFVIGLFVVLTAVVITVGVITTVVAVRGCEDGFEMNIGFYSCHSDHGSDEAPLTG